MICRLQGTQDAKPNSQWPVQLGLAFPERDFENQKLSSSSPASVKWKADSSMID